MEFIKSQRGKNLLVHNNHIYYLNKQNNASQHWNSKVRTCIGSLKLEYSGEIALSDHNHPLDLNDLDKRKMDQRLKDKGENTTCLTREIYENTVLIEGKSTLQKRNSVYKNILNVRKKKKK
jgi:hypothetical protein